MSESCGLKPIEVDRVPKPIEVNIGLKPNCDEEEAHFCRSDTKTVLSLIFVGFPVACPGVSCAWASSRSSPVAFEMDEQKSKRD